MTQTISTFPHVSVIIPCRNEKDYIGPCLDSLVENDYPNEKLEVIVVDGKSCDNTKNIIENYQKRYSFIKLKDNPNKIQNYAMNIGLKDARGRIIIRCDSHSVYCRDYISKLVSWHQKEKDIGNVGGIWLHQFDKNTIKAKAIALVQSHSFGVGPNRYRVGSKQIAFVDTVPFGSWKREIFDEIGFFDENILKGEDLDFNIRLKKKGYKILLDPDIEIYYHPRCDFNKLYSMMYQYAYWKIKIIKKHKTLPSIRQLAPPLLIIYMIMAAIISPLISLVWIPLMAYVCLSALFGLQISAAQKDIKILFPCIYAFWSMHFGYGIGYIHGIWDVFIKNSKTVSLKQKEMTR